MGTLHGGSAPLLSPLAEVAVIRLAVRTFLSDTWRVRGNEFVRLARHASPSTKLILFSAVVGNIEGWIAVAGLSAPRPDAIVEKPNAWKLMTVLCQMR